MSGVGVLLGTAALHVTEQAKGQARGQTQRHLGVRLVLYEMLTGKRASRVMTSSDTLANIFKDAARNWHARCPPNTPCVYSDACCADVWRKRSSSISPRVADASHRAH
jgi:hypothetical protein